MAIPALRYQVGGAGFPVAQPQSMVIPVGTVVDTSQAEWSWMANVAPPIDCIPLTQVTYDYMTSTGGQIGLGYDVARVAWGPGVVTAALDPPTGDWWSKPSHKEPQG